ncbi:alpha/beta fold hydrolase [Gordonia sp. CPCC 205515]|uniref:alpha/beta fold hydrolase n=1 Tax=Gordonia sp. CPCC 205515 TaxID=3140791 RepID=UPI003AF373F2
MTTAVARLHVVAHPSRREIRSEVPVVLLHGIGGSAQSCAPLAERLAAQGHPAWCVDAPGYGQSADPITGTDTADEISELLEQQWAGRPVVLLGTSFGGVVAMTVALRRPDLVAGLVLADSTRGSGTTEQKATAMRARVTELFEQGAYQVAAARAPRLTAPDADPAIAAAVRTSMAALRPTGFGAAAEFMAATDLGPRLAEIACPTLVLVGEHDAITGVDESRLLADRIPGATLHIIDAAGHVAIQEQPAAIADLVGAFLGGLS